MKKTKLFIAEENYFIRDTINEFNNLIQDNISQKILLYKKNSNRLFSTKEKIKYFTKSAEEVKKLFNKELFKNVFEYKIDIELKTCHVFESSILDICQTFYDPNIDKEKEDISIWQEELFYNLYSRNFFEVEYIYDSQEFMEIFFRLKGNYFFKQFTVYLEYLLLIDLKQLELDKSVLDNLISQTNESIPTTKNETLQWYGTQTQLIELIKALIENGNLKGEQENIFKIIQRMFNFKLNNIDQAITKYNGRHQGDEAIFLKNLQNTFLNYIKDKDEKKKQNL